MKKFVLAVACGLALTGVAQAGNFDEAVAKLNARRDILAKGCISLKKPSRLRDNSEPVSFYRANVKGAGDKPGLERFSQFRKAYVEKEVQSLGEKYGSISANFPDVLEGAGTAKQHSYATLISTWSDVELEFADDDYIKLIYLLVSPALDASEAGKATQNYTKYNGLDVSMMQELCTITRFNSSISADTILYSQFKYQKQFKRTEKQNKFFAALLTGDKQGALDVVRSVPGAFWKRQIQELCVDNKLGLDLRK